MCSQSAWSDCRGHESNLEIPVPEFIDPRFRETSPKRSYSVIENERIGLVFAKTVSIISGTGVLTAVSAFRGRKDVFYR